jgi:tetraacyldisaccharide 4'-kinase
MLKKIINNLLKHRKIITANVPVISVGNISFGGTGKTPFVIYLCELLKKLKYKPAVIGRGYKRKSKNDVVVSNGKSILVDVATGGDEMVLIAKHTEVPVFAGKSKSNLVAKMNNNDTDINYSYNFDCIVIDDGFQHKQLYRNLDIVLVDKKSMKNIFKRERIKSLKRANLIVCSNGLIKEDLINYYDVNLQNVITIKKNNNIPYNLFTNDKSKLFYDKVLALVGIASPNRFLDTLPYNIVGLLKYSDHHYYTTKDITKIINKCKQNECKVIVTTEKDAVKLFSYEEIFMQHNIEVIVFPIVIEIKKEDEDILKKLLLTLFC